MHIPETHWRMALTQYTTCTLTKFELRRKGVDLTVDGIWAAGTSV